MLTIVIHIIQQQVADEIDLHQVFAVTHQQHGIRVADQVDPVANTRSAQQQSVTHMVIGFINFTGVDSQRYPGNIPAQFAQGRQETQWVAFVIVLAPDHIDPDEQIAVLVNEAVDPLKVFFGIFDKAQQIILHARGYTGRHRIRLRQALAKNIRNLVRRERTAVRAGVKARTLHGLKIGESLAGKCLHVLHQHLGIDVGVAPQVVQALPVGLEKFLAPLMLFIQPQAVHPCRFFPRVQRVNLLVFALFAVRQGRVARCLQIAEVQQVGGKAEHVLAVTHAIIDPHPGVIFVATIQCFVGSQLVPPLTEIRAREMVMQVAPLGQRIEKPVQVAIVGGGLEGLEPIFRGSRRRAHNTRQHARTKNPRAESDRFVSLGCGQDRTPT